MINPYQPGARHTPHIPSLGDRVTMHIDDEILEGRSTYASQHLSGIAPASRQSPPEQFMEMIQEVYHARQRMLSGPEATGVLSEFFLSIL
jgi:hypothetical protein